VWSIKRGENIELLPEKAMLQHDKKSGIRFSIFRETGFRTEVP
jgi:hypothetical protein